MVPRATTRHSMMNWGQDLPLLPRGAAKRTDFARPEVLVPEPQVPEEREELLVPVSELHEALRLPKGARSSQFHSKFIAVCSHLRSRRLINGNRKTEQEMTIAERIVGSSGWYYRHNCRLLGRRCGRLAEAEVASLVLSLLGE